jgi:PPM family protein phosphatase
VRAALHGGGEDNVTAIVFRLGETAADGAAATATPQQAAAPAGPRAQARVHRSRGRTAARVALAAVVLVAAGGGAGAGLSWSHFVGADRATGRVAVYQGVPVELPFGLRLYHETYASPVSYATLTATQRRSLFDHRLRSTSDAMHTVAAIERTTP